jgi:hypothetical protein
MCFSGKGPRLEREAGGPATHFAANAPRTAEQLVWQLR